MPYGVVCTASSYHNKLLVPSSHPVFQYQLVGHFAAEALCTKSQSLVTLLSLCGISSHTDPELLPWIPPRTIIRGPRSVSLAYSSVVIA